MLTSLPPDPADPRPPPDLKYLEELTAAMETTLCSLYEGIAINFPHMRPEVVRIWGLHCADVLKASEKLKERHERG